MKPSSGTQIPVSLVCALTLALVALACATEAQREPVVAPGPSAASSSAPPPAAPPTDAELVPKPEPPQQDPNSPSPTATTAAAPASTSTSTPTPTPTPESPALATLHRYYADLNAHRFEANRYFAPSVKNYITMRKPTANAIDHYLRDVFPKQFESYEFLLDENTLREERPNVFTFVERSRYYLVKSREFRENLAQVRVEFDADGKIVDFRHTQVLAREKTPELRD